MIVSAVSEIPLRRRILGISEIIVSADPNDEITTYALGSCVGVIVWDPVAKVGGMLHAMLPDSQLDPAKAAATPAMFVDTGVPLLFKECYKLGAKKERMIVKVAGGAAIHAEGQNDRFQIGKRNVLMLRKLFFKNNVIIKGEDVEGTDSRTVSLNVGTGEMRLRKNGDSILL